MGHVVIAAAISIHALREEGDRAVCRRPTPSTYFYPRPPRGGRRQQSPKRDVEPGISIHALREEGDLQSRADEEGANISIHALREEGDATWLSIFYHSLISIHALREEGDSAVLPVLPLSEGFLSTPSARRATAMLCFLRLLPSYFYPRPPRGGRRRFITCSTSAKLFLSTPSARRATGQCFSGVVGGGFLSTPSARRATVQADSLRHPGAISIHALREEGDVFS